MVLKNFLGAYAQSSTLKSFLLHCMNPINKIQGENREDRKILLSGLLGKSS